VVYGGWVGASRSRGPKPREVIPRRFGSLVSVIALVLLIGFSTGCADDGAAPDRLLDGSITDAPPVELQSVGGPALLTKVRLVQPSKQDEEERSSSCLRARDTVHPRGPSVERIGVYSETVTFEESSARAIFGCDNSSGPREENRRWCGGAYGQLYGGELRDPRLNIGCLTGDDEMVGFVWVQPSDAARYVSVEQPEYVEVYEVAGTLPVRIATTTGVQVEGSRASFDLFEHTADGSLVRRYRVEAAVAG
jgi:hypothetical protein